MINIEKLEIYTRYGGDIDGWARVKDTREHQLMSDLDWRQIESLLQLLTSMKRGLLTPGFSKEVSARLDAETSDSDAMRMLLDMAGRF